MNTLTLNNIEKAGILQCARQCEQARTRVAWNEARGNPEAAADWRERAEWWACQAFREMDAARAARALAQVAA